MEKKELKPTPLKIEMYCIGRYFGENLYLETNNEKVAEIAQKHFNEAILADIRFSPTQL
jgi:hypothetical protein